MSDVRSRVHHSNGQPHRELSVTFPQKAGDALLGLLAPGVNFAGIILVITASAAAVVTVSRQWEHGAERKAAAAHVFKAQDTCLAMKAAVARRA